MDQQPSFRQALVPNPVGLTAFALFNAKLWR